MMPGNFLRDNSYMSPTGRGQMRMKDGVILLQYRNPKAQKLTKGHEGDAGWDLYCTEDRIIWPKSAIDLDTGWNINVPRGTWGLITARSSTFKRRRLIVQDGVIDSGYTGPLTILVWNPGFLPKKIRAGERLAQLIIVPLPETVIQLTDKMPETSRGKQCFGSTGN